MKRIQGIVTKQSVNAVRVIQIIRDTTGQGHALPAEFQVGTRVEIEFMQPPTSFKMEARRG